ncbi:MAG TPA: helix-turn-helix transcriptional regulator [Streptosporangiaceae bacterium]|nr:helix-turn-helix transcriptional regulator [Streptosporangiaceae bacterium]
MMAEAGVAGGVAAGVAAGAVADRYWLVRLDGAKLRELRTGRGLSKVSLAHRAGISPATVANLERQVSPRCHVRTAAKLAAALDLPPTALAVPSDQP